MKRFFRYACFLGALVSAASAAMEQWTRERDGATIRAELKEFDAESGEVSLKLEDGRDAVISEAILIEAHRQRLQKIAAEIAAKEEASKKPRLETVTPEDGGGHKLHVYKPAGYLDGDPANRKRPIAFLYAPGGHSMRVLKRLKPAAGELGWVLVGVDAYRNTKSVEHRYDERMDNTASAFEWVEENVEFASDKIVFGGMSGGAWWSYQSASDLTRDAAGILAFGGWMGKMHDKRYSRDMAVVMINGSKDKNAIHFETIDGDFLRDRASADVKIFRFSGGHTLAPADVARKAARWIHETKQFGGGY